MERAISTKFVYVFFIVLLFFNFNLILVGALMGNESNCAFSQSCNNGGNSGDKPNPPPTLSARTGSINILSSLIVEGGSYFLKSLGDIHHFLNRVESSELYGFDVKVLSENMNSAIDAMEKAQSAYWQLKIISTDTPYNHVVLNKLKNFNYEHFQIKNELIPSVFESVKAFLASGDVRGVYGHFYSNCGSILSILYKIKEALYNGNKLVLSDQWRLSQQCSEIKLFGQYVAEVFHAIR